MNLILLDADEVSDDGAVRLSGARAEHLLSVLKAAPGHTVRVGVIDGAIGIGTVTGTVTGTSTSVATEANGAEGANSANSTVTLQCVFEAAVPPRPPVDLLLAVPRPKVLRRLWPQLAALGVGQIVLTNAARVERNYFDTHVLTPECYRPLLIEGLQQARDTRLPRVSVHRQFRALVEDQLDALCPTGLRLVAHADTVHPGAGLSVEAAVRSGAGERVLLAVGPEGGWNAFELALLESRGFTRVGMGPRTLRSDTACVALMALVHQASRARTQASGQSAQA